VRNRLLASALASGTEDIDVDALVEDENNVKPNEMKEDGEAEEDEYKPEFDWNDTEDMTKYDSAMFDRYLKEHSGLMGTIRNLVSR